MLQRLAVQLWTSPTAARSVARAAQSYDRRRGQLITQLAQRGIPSMGRTGLNVWIPVPDEATSVAFLLQKGWAVAPGARFRQASPPGIRVTVGALDEDGIPRFADSLAEVIDPADMTELLDARREEHGLVGTQRRAPRAAVCADIYTRCVNTQTTVAEVVRGGFPWCEDYTSQLSGLFRRYVAHKRSHGLVDFDDLLLLWRAALADPAAGPVLRGMFDAVLVDEYQDVNALQADIVRLLAPESGCLTCVGSQCCPAWHTCPRRSAPTSICCGPTD